MRQATCAACHSTFPLGDTYSVAQLVLCSPCAHDYANSLKAAGSPVTGIGRNVDTTVCVHCSADSGPNEWSILAGRPSCDKCTDFFRNRPFPGWLKIPAAIFICVAVAAFAYNFRYFMAYVEQLRGVRALTRGDVVSGVALLDSAANRVPEVPELSVVPNLLKAKQAIADGRNEEGLALLQKARRHAPADWANTIRSTELEAEIGIAFDAHDYDAFLTAWWSEHKRYGTLGTRPVLVFVCPTLKRAEQLAALADELMTGGIGHSGTPPQTWYYAGRDHTFFMAEEDIYHGSLRALALHRWPPRLRDALGQGAHPQPEFVSLMPPAMTGASKRAQPTG